MGAVTVFIVLVVDSELVQLSELFVLVEVRFVTARLVRSVLLESVIDAGLLFERFVVEDLLVVVLSYIGFDTITFFLIR